MYISPSPVSCVAYGPGVSYSSRKCSPNRRCVLLSRSVVRSVQVLHTQPGHLREYGSPTLPLRYHSRGSFDTRTDGSRNGKRQHRVCTFLSGCVCHTARSPYRRPESSNVPLSGLCLPTRECR